MSDPEKDVPRPPPPIWWDDEWTRTVAVVALILAIVAIVLALASW